MSAVEIEPAAPASGIARLGGYLVVAGWFFAPLNAVHAIPPPPTINLSDALMWLGFGLLLPSMLRKPVRLPAEYLAGAIVLVAAILASTALLADPVSNLSALRIVYAIVVIPLLLTQWDPPWRTITWLATAYVAGAFVSLFYGYLTGPLDNGRYLGLGTHPNALGHAFALSATLLPFLAHGRSRAGRWLLVPVALGCLVGVVQSGSRASLLALVLVLLVYVVVEGTALVGLWALLSAALGVALWSSISQLAAGNDVLARFTGQGDASLSDQQRLLFLQATLNRFHDHPLLGGGFPLLREAHNTHLEVLAGAGLIGFAGWVILLVAIGLPILRRHDPRHLLAYPAVFLVAVGSVEVLFETLHWAVLSLALLATLRRRPAPVAPPGRSQHEPSGPPIGRTR